MLQNNGTREGGTWMEGQAPIPVPQMPPCYRGGESRAKVPHYGPLPAPALIFGPGTFLLQDMPV